MTTKTYEEILAEIKSLREENKRLKKNYKYGLVWEDKEELFDIQSQNALPVVVEKGGNFKDVISDKNDDFNILIEGDNYHSLSVLSYTHKNKIDVIYIDPPYNTGKKDFIYNDSFVDKEDSFRHSKWLSFMNKRLQLAKLLLKDDGVIIISIDDNEQAQLRMLCDGIFGENNFVNNFMWLHGKGKKTKQSRTMQQYNLVYSKNKYNLPFWLDYKMSSGTFSNPDNDERGVWFSGSISFSEDRSNKNSGNYFSIKSPSGLVWERQWQCTKKEMDEYLLDKKIYFGTEPEYSNVPRIKIFPDEEKEIIPENILSEQGTTRGAQGDLDSIMGGNVFDNPKPVELIKHFLKIIKQKNENIMILDFMAGSGTTGHAVLELNKDDGGDRKFILCTNNENNICEDVTWERIKRVSQGHKNLKGEAIVGLGGNLKYLKTDFIEKQIENKITDEDKINLTYAVGTLLALKENTFTELEKNKYYQIFKGKDKITAIYFRENKEKLDELLKKISKENKQTKLYIFSWDKGSYKGSFEEYGNIISEDIPEPILEIYKNIGL
jgi:adenine-specific DNA-methyltransferase